MRRVGLGVVLGVSIAALVGVLHLAVAHARRPSPQTSALSIAVRVISDRVAFAEHTLAVTHRRVPRAYVVSLATMSYVVGHVSATQSGYLHEVAHQPLPTDAEQSLQTGAGICGTATN